ncbi:MAG: LysR family transcriptional regulator [Sandaracinus sp.]|nr:LysR family transcriptional regulator [Sandaracinus sp.]MCB9616496.1 LysR family transcriptional regulator [Sandaracinus sp.]MCB9621070.1 LysR family transcriptional regulator [Sandaracinus sp.]
MTPGAWPDVDLDLLRVLDVLLRTESTVLAARELGLTQSAVSHALRRLREAFGDPLLVRVGRRFVPTERARELAPALAEARLAVTRVLAPRETFDPAKLRTTFRMALADYAESVILPGLLTTLATDAPEVDLVTTLSGDALEEDLQHGRVDLACGGFFQERAGLVLRTLFRDPLVCVRRPTKGRLTLARYLAARHVLVSPRGRPGGIVDDHLAAANQTRRVVLRTPTFQTAITLAARTDLLVTIPESLARLHAEHAPLTVEPLPFELPPLRFAMAYAASRKDDVSHRWLRERVVEAAQARAPKRRGK